MHTHKIYTLLFLIAFLGIFGCGDESDDPGLFISGTYSVPEAFINPDSPVLVAVSNSIDSDVL